MKAVHYNMKKSIVNISFILMCLINLIGCERDRNGDPIEIIVKNNSTYSVYFVTQFNYPDTSLINFTTATSEVRGTTLSPHSESKFLALTGWEREIKERNAKETLIILTYSLDTLKKYTFEQIQQDYNILRRYDLCIEQLRAMNWTVISP